MYKNMFEPSGSEKIRVKETVHINSTFLPVEDLGNTRAIVSFSGKTGVVYCRT